MFTVVLGEDSPFPQTTRETSPWLIKFAPAMPAVTATGGLHLFMQLHICFLWRLWSLSAHLFTLRVAFPRSWHGWVHVSHDVRATDQALSSDAGVSTCSWGADLEWKFGLKLKKTLKLRYSLCVESHMIKGYMQHLAIKITGFAVGFGFAGKVFNQLKGFVFIVKTFYW